MKTSEIAGSARGRCVHCLSPSQRMRIVMLAAAATTLAVTASAVADQWTGAGQTGVPRQWGIGPNWLAGVVPPANDVDVFGLLGDGTVDLNAPQFAGGLIFKDFTNTAINPLAGNALSLVPPLFAPNPSIVAPENLRETYACDYFTAGPTINAPLALQSQQLNINLGTIQRSAMLLGGTITAFPGAVINYNGFGFTSSLWLTANTVFPNPQLLPQTIINVGTPAGANSLSHTLHLADGGRLDNALINLTGSQAYLGLHNSSPFPMATYTNDLNVMDGGVIFTDRSYQLWDLDSSINRWQNIVGLLTVMNRVDFGSTGGYGMTNNGFWIEVSKTRLHTLDGQSQVFVNNGYLTQQRAGNRYISGTNRLNEPHNYTIFNDIVDEQSGSLLKDGTGVLVLLHDNSNWNGNKTVNRGVLRIGGPTALGSPLVQAVTISPDAGVGIGWNTPVDLSVIPQVPFTVNAPPLPAGQTGAIDIDMWGHTFNINTNFGPFPMGGYLRVGSSMGADASFDPQPQINKHASTRGFITPYIFAQGPQPTGIYYFGGGGGTLRVDSILNEVEYRTQLEMGTTGQLLPGRVALNPLSQMGIPANNLYTGTTWARAGTLQLMYPTGAALFSGAVWGTQQVSLGTYNTDMIQGEYQNFAIPNPNNWRWTGPGQLLIDPDVNGNMNLGRYLTNQGLNTLQNTLLLDGGVIGWTGNVTLNGPPGQYGATINSDLTAPAGGLIPVNVLGLGGEYSAGVMKLAMPWFIEDTPQGMPVLLYKCGVNSTLDLTNTPTPFGNTFTGGTVIAGGEILVSNANQLNAHQNGAGGPIVLQNGGRLHLTQNSTIFEKDVILGARGLPDSGTLYNGSMFEVDLHLQATLQGRLMVGSTSTRAPLEKLGKGVLFLDYQVGGIPQQYPRDSQNLWGLKLTEGLVSTNQLPFSPNSVGGYLVCNGDPGDTVWNGSVLQVRSAPPNFVFADPADSYGFESLVSFARTQSWIEVLDPQTGAVGANVFRVSGAASYDWMGTVIFRPLNGDGDDTNNVYHLSRNAAGPLAVSPGQDSRGTGTLDVRGGLVKLTTNVNGVRVLPQETGFTLKLNGGIFNGMPQADLNGNLIVNDVVATGNPRMDGQSYSANGLVATPTTWTIGLTGLTSWNGTLEKIGSGTVLFNRQLGAPVTVAAGSILKISGGTLDAGGPVDPFTDSVLPNIHVAINNNANFNVIQGSKDVASISGTGTTTVVGGATLNVGSSGPIGQGTLLVNGYVDAGNVDVISLTDVSATATSAAQLNANYVRTGTLNISSSAAQFASVYIKLDGSNSGVSRVNALNISGPIATPTARIDLTDNDLVIDYTGATPYNNVVNWVRAGYNAGVWNGNGIASSRAGTSPNPGEGGKTGVGYAEASTIYSVFPATFSGQSVDNSSVLIKYTYLGDANLDGQVDISDLGILATNWQTPGDWPQADFDYSGFIDISDLGRLATNWQVGVGSPLGPSFDVALASFGLPGASVPEPTSVGMLGMAVLGLRRRHRRS